MTADTEVGRFGRVLADKILQSKSALEGGRKQVTVLFADVKGSTSEPALFLKRHP